MLSTFSRTVPSSVYEASILLCLLVSCIVFISQLRSVHALAFVACILNLEKICNLGSCMIKFQMKHSASINSGNVILSKLIHGTVLY